MEHQATRSRRISKSRPEGVLRQFEFAPLAAQRIHSIDGSLYFSLYTSTIPSGRSSEAPFAQLVGDEPVVVTRSEAKDLLTLFSKASVTEIDRYNDELSALPQSSLDWLDRARSNWAQSTRSSAQVEPNEMGPTHLFGGRLWFGKTFYDGEGLSGVGGFGYFDPHEKRIEEFSPPEILRWSASALLVEEGVVWIGRFRRP